MLFGLKSILENTTVCDSDAQLSPYAAQEIAYECNLELLKLKEYECECESTVLEQYRNAKYANSSITMESFAPQLRVVQEGFLKNWYEKVKKFVIKIWNNIKNFFKKLFGKSASESENFRIWLEKNKAKFANIPDNYEYKATAIDYFSCITGWSGYLDKLTKAIKNYTDLVDAGTGDGSSPLGDKQTADAYIADKLNISVSEGKSLITELTKKLHGDKEQPGEIKLGKTTVTYATCIGNLTTLNKLEKNMSSLDKDIEKSKKVVEALIAEGLKVDDKASEDEKKKAKDKTEKALKAYQEICKSTTSVIQLFMKEIKAARSFMATVAKDAVGKATDKKDDSKKTDDTKTKQPDDQTGDN